jgi:small subunit ribosomal protein S17e
MLATDLMFDISITFINPSSFFCPMGRIKTRLVKAITHSLLEEYRDSFSTNYEENKVKVAELVSVKSKKLRNIIAGYVTRIIKAQAS